MFCDITFTDNPKAVTASLNKDLERMKIWSIGERWTLSHPNAKHWQYQGRGILLGWTSCLTTPKWLKRKNWRFAVSQLTTRWPGQNTSPTFHPQQDSGKAPREESPTNLKLEVEQLQSTKRRYAVWWCMTHSPGWVPAPPLWDYLTQYIGMHINFYSPSFTPLNIIMKISINSALGETGKIPQVFLSSNAVDFLYTLKLLQKRQIKVGFFFFFIIYKTYF